MSQLERMRNGVPRRRGFATGEARFITQVRMQEMLAGEHPYSYAFNNPTTYTDPSGLNPQHSHLGRKRGPWNNPNCDSVAATALASLSSCFDSKSAATLSAVLLCMAYGESDCNKNDKSSPNFGLYSLDCGQYNACRPANCPPCGKTGPDSGCGIFQQGCSTQAAVSFIAYLINKHQGTLGDVLCLNWGVFPCTGRSEQNEKTLTCLAAKGINVFKIPAPRPLPTCPPCQGKP